MHDAPGRVPAAVSSGLLEACPSIPSGKGLLPPIFGVVDDEFPPGNALHHPDIEVHVVPLSPAMRDMERCLDRALIVCVAGGTRPAVSSHDVALAIHVERGLPLDCFSVHPYHPENFLVVFDNLSTKDRVLHGGSIKTCQFFLLVRPWSHLA